MCTCTFDVDIEEDILALSNKILQVLSRKNSYFLFRSFRFLLILERENVQQLFKNNRLHCNRILKYGVGFVTLFMFRKKSLLIISVYISKVFSQSVFQVSQNFFVSV